VVAYAAYLGKMLWPASYRSSTPIPIGLFSWAVGGSVLLLAGVTVLALRLARRAPYLAVDGSGTSVRSCP